MSNGLSLRIELKTSYILLTLLLFIHIGAVFCLWITAFALWIKLLVMSLVLFSLYYTILNHVFHCHHYSIDQLQQQADGSWLLYQHNGDCTVGELMGNSLVTTFICILNFKVYERFQPIAVIIVPDAVATADFRRLCMLLRFLI